MLERLRVAPLPGREFIGSFPAQLYAALEQQDVSVHFEAQLGLRWLWRHRHEIDVLHFHRPQFYYHPRRSARGPLSSALTAWLAFRFVCSVGLARRLGMRVVWSVHSLSSYDARPRRLDRRVERRLAARCDRIIAHCARAKRELVASFHIKPQSVAVIPIGHFARAYEDEVGREQARQHLGIAPDRFVYLHFGGMCSRNGVSSLILAFRALADAEAQLWLVGPPDGPGVAAAAREAAQEGEERIVARLECVPDDDVKLYFAACDVSVLPYAEALSPWEVMFSLSFGVPVVAPAAGCIPELVGPREGLLYDPNRSDGLAEALRRARTATFVPRQRIRGRAREAYRWDRVAALTKAVYMEALGRG